MGYEEPPAERDGTHRSRRVRQMPGTPTADRGSHFHHYEAGMPIRGDRLRWPPRPGKRSDAALSSARRSTSDTASSAAAKQPLQEPRSNRDESADREIPSPRKSTQQPHDSGSSAEKFGRGKQADNVVTGDDE